MDVIALNVHSVCIRRAVPHRDRDVNSILHRSGTAIGWPQPATPLTQGLYIPKGSEGTVAEDRGSTLGLFHHQTPPGNIDEQVLRGLAG